MSSAQAFCRSCLILPPAFLNHIFHSSFFTHILLHLLCCPIFFVFLCKVFVKLEKSLIRLKKNNTKCKRKPITTYFGFFRKETVDKQNLLRILLQNVLFLVLTTNYKQHAKKRLFLLCLHFFHLWKRLLRLFSMPAEASSARITMACKGSVVFL